MKSPRLEYQKMFAKGRVVNIGCGDNPAGFGPDTVQVDYDLYNYPNFVQADAHNLPFKDDEFDTAVLGDILEHSPDPVKMLSEAGRVAKKVVATIFEEWRHVGKSTEERIEIAKEELREMGFNTLGEYYRSLPAYKDNIVSVKDDSEIPHHYHIQNFTDGDIFDMVKKAGLEFEIYHKFREGVHEGKQWYNWVVVAKKAGVDVPRGTQDIIP